MGQTNRRRYRRRMRYSILRITALLACVALMVLAVVLFGKFLGTLWEFGRKLANTEYQGGVEPASGLFGGQLDGQPGEVLDGQQEGNQGILFGEVEGKGIETDRRTLPAIWASLPSETLEQLARLVQEEERAEELFLRPELYPEALLTALGNNAELLEFALAYPTAERKVTDGLTVEEQEAKVPFLLQWDARWGYAPYGTGSCIGLSGCGPTCLSMVCLALTRDKALTPDKLAAYAEKNGYYVAGSGSTWTLMDNAPVEYGLKSERIPLMESRMKKELSAGKLIICSMGKGDFTTGGHFIVLYDYSPDGFFVYDPNSVSRSTAWSYERLEHQIKCIWAIGKDEEK